MEGVIEHNQQPRVVSAIKAEEHLGTHVLMKRKEIWWELRKMITSGRIVKVG